MSTGHKLALPDGCVINQYRIEAVLGHGGFGIVYQAVHQQLGHLVAIKEYLPQELAVRDGARVQPISEREAASYQYGKERFLSEAKELVQFRHPNIVRCSDFIEANGTAYLVMDYEDGLPLSALLTMREKASNPLTEDEVRQVILPILDGLGEVHSHDMLHRDIKPSNIFIRRATEEPVLIDFGSAKQGFSERSKSMAPFTEGYAAMEQVERAGNLGPWTDIYALGALTWRIIAGVNPPPVENRSFALLRGNPDPLKPAVECGKGQYSRGLLEAIDRCLAIRELDRYQSVQELQEALDEPPTLDQPQRKARKARAPKAAATRSRAAPAKTQTSRKRPAKTAAATRAATRAAATATAAATARKRATRTAAAKAPPAPRRTARAPARSPRPAKASAAPSQARQPLRALGQALVHLPGNALNALETTLAYFVRASATLSLVVFAGVLGSRLVFDDPGGIRGQPSQWPEFRWPVREVQRLWVRVTPGDASIHLPEIGAGYRPGMTLPPGRYQLEVSAPGHEPQSLSLRIRNRDLTLDVRLEPSMHPGAVFRDSLPGGEEGPEMVVLPAGSFRMGDLNALGDADEKPVREVTIPRPIAMMRYEVTRGDFRRFAYGSGYRTEAERNTDGSQGCRMLLATEPGGAAWSYRAGRNWRNADLYGMTQASESHPVLCVTWNDAQAYAEWLSDQTGKRYRLPSEAEWEYAARAGTATPWSYGDRSGRQCRYANGADETRLPNDQVYNQAAACRDGYAFTARVGAFRANDFQLHDMHGNVWEWVQDCYQSSYAGAPRNGKARESCEAPEEGEAPDRVLRGGSWGNTPSWLRSANRTGFKPSLRNAASGFRLVQEIPE